MSTLEQERPITTTTTSTINSPLDDISELVASVPTPFPSRGRTIGTVNESTTTTPINTTTTTGVRNSSRSPSVGRLGGVFEKVKRAMSRDRMNLNGGDNHTLIGDRDSIAESAVTEEYRGRLNPLSATGTRTSSQTRIVHSTGRGGAGNTTRSASRGRGLAPQIEGEEEKELIDETKEAILKAREKSDSRSRSRGRVEIVASGRGGRGNIRSPSRDPGLMELAKKEEEYEKEVEEARKKAGPAGKSISSGRGGRGNIKTMKVNSTALGGMAA